MIGKGRAYGSSVHYSGKARRIEIVMSIVENIQHRREQARRTKQARYVALVAKAEPLTPGEIAGLDQILVDLGVSLTEFGRITADLAELRVIESQGQPISFVADRAKALRSKLATFL